jgi:penicillin-binding protein 1A
MTWHQIMAYAHQGIETKNLAGLPAPAPPKPVDVVAEAKPTDVPIRPPLLTRRGADALQHIERLMDNVARQLGVASLPAGGDERSAQVRDETIATAAGRPAVSAVRGN